MKKAIIVLLSVLLVITLASCNQDKSAEVAETFEEFTDAYVICNSLKQALNGNIKYDATTETEADLESIHGTALRNYLEELYNDDKCDEIDVKTSSVTGKVKGTDDNCSFSNVKIEATYTKTLNGVEDKDVLTEQTEMSGSYFHEETPSETAEGETMDYVYRFNFTVDGKQYNLSYSSRYVKGLDGEESYYYTSASINGKDVNLKLLEAPFVTHHD